MGKSPLFSKTLWLNLFGGAAFLLQSEFGYLLPPQYQALGLAAANFGLRLITGEPIDWSKVKMPGSAADVLLVLLAAPMLLLGGCSAKPFTPPKACDGSPSIILETIPDPQALDKALLTVNLAAMETVKGYGADDALAVIDQVDAMIDGPAMTYAELVAYVMGKVRVANSLAGAAIFVLGPDLDLLSRPSPVSPCDVELVRAHLARQRAMIAIYAAR